MFGFHALYRTKIKVRERITIRNKIFYLLVGFIILIPFLQMVPDRSRQDSDTYWHLLLGMEMIQKGHILKEAIYTFAGSHLPYVAHEIGFQLIAGAIYKWGGWQGLHLLTVACIGLTAWGLLTLGKLGRLEVGLSKYHPFLFFFVPVVTEYLYLLYFKLRPQMLSTPIILWFVIWLLYFRKDPSLKKGIALGFLSLLLSNIHAGVWPVIFVFFLMLIIERLILRYITRNDFYALMAICVGGLLTIGGWKTLFYFITVGDSDFTFWIQEWHPISFMKEWNFFAVIAIFLWALSRSEIKGIFPFIFSMGILYLGLANYKQHLYLFLLFIFFIAATAEKIPLIKYFDRFTWLNVRFFYSLVTVGLTINLLWGVLFIAPDDRKEYPVEEMGFILQASKGRPNVLADYNVSGYVMFRGGNVLADGRFDPFVLDKTKGIFGWTALERSVYALRSEYLPVILMYDKPDFLILPKTKDDNKKPQILTLEKLKQQYLGKPDFSGEYGDVWRINYEVNANYRPSHYSEKNIVHLSN